ncbi:MAG: ABC transporter ATP-binding protein [Akkermansiaceae bacterium]|nr:ABC transporter ATP-binding protein [Akkermansiaceae bacterium]NNM28335.1 ABC transporter ATP-binding protein [Akkermansiaceae bacterium]
MNGAIEIRDLRVDYGDFIAVHDLNLTVPWGEVFGLVGPNGAGKTSSFRVLATLMEPTYGEVSVAGYDVLEETSAARRVMGYMPDLAPVPSDLKVWEFLDFHADTHALGSRGERRDRAEECLGTVDLLDKREAWCRALSRGQTQRLVLAKTLLHRPKVLILDEPASGLDPLSRRELRIALQRLAREGATVFVSSHILSELAEMCSSLCVMNQGRLLASGTAEEVRRELGRSDRHLTVTVLNGREPVVDWLGRRDGVHDVGGEGREVRFGYKGDDDGQVALLADMMRDGLRVKAFEERGSSFEEILVEVAENNRKT